MGDLSRECWRIVRNEATFRSPRYPKSSPPVTPTGRRRKFLAGHIICTCIAAHDMRKCTRKGEMFGVGTWHIDGDDIVTVLKTF